MGFKIKGVHWFSLRLVSLVALSSFIISTQFIDPINWPKQVALCVAVPLILLTIFNAEKSGLVNYSNRKLHLLFAISISGFLLVGIFSPTSWIRTLWGAFGRNNGLVTQISLLFLAWMFSMLVITPATALSLMRAIQYFMYLPITYGLIQYFGIDPVVWSTTNQVFSFFGNINFASAIFGFSAFVSALLFVIEKEVKYRIFATLSFLCAALLTYLTDSLQGLIILGFGLFISFFIYVRERNPKFAMPYLFAGSVLGFVIFLAFLGLGPLGSLLEQYTLKLRLYYAQVGILMGMSSPIFGVGVDSYGDAFRLHRPQALLDLVGLDIVVNNAHSSLVQVFATTGVIGLASLLLVVLPAYLVSGRILLSKSAPSEAVIISGVFLALFSASLLSIDNISIAIWNYMFLGITLSYFGNKQNAPDNKYEKRVIREVKNREVIKIITRLSAVLIFTTSWLSSNPSREIVRILNLPVYADNQESLKAREIRLVNLSNSIFMRESDFRLVAEALLAIGYTPTAADVLRLGIAKFPLDFTLHDYAAVVNEKFFSRAESIIYRERQVVLDERDSRIWIQLAYDYDAAGRTVDARRAFNNAIKYANLATLEFRETLPEVAKEIGISD